MSAVAFVLCYGVVWCGVCAACCVALRVVSLCEFLVFVCVCVRACVCLFVVCVRCERV